MNRYERGKQLGHDWKAMDKPNWYRCNSCGREVEITFYIDDPHSIAAEMNLPVCSRKPVDLHVYILTSGDYEDSQIDAVFIDFNNAIKFYKESYNCRIQKWIPGAERPKAILYPQTESGYKWNYKRVNSITELKDA